jgi:hypothetical protein
MMAIQPTDQIHISAISSTIPTTNMNSSALNASAARETNPYRSHVTATMEATKAMGAVENSTLGPSQVSG